MHQTDHPSPCFLSGLCRDALTCRLAHNPDSSLPPRSPQLAVPAFTSAAGEKNGWRTHRLERRVHHRAAPCTANKGDFALNHARKPRSKRNVLYVFPNSLYESSEEISAVSLVQVSGFVSSAASAYFFSERPVFSGSSSCLIRNWLSFKVGDLFNYDWRILSDV